MLNTLVLGRVFGTRLKLPYLVALSPFLTVRISAWLSTAAAYLAVFFAVSALVSVISSGFSNLPVTFVSWMFAAVFFTMLFHMVKNNADERITRRVHSVFINIFLDMEEGLVEFEETDIHSTLREDIRKNYFEYSGFQVDNLNDGQMQWLEKEWKMIVSVATKQSNERLSRTESS